LCVKPTQSFHLIDSNEEGMASRITPVAEMEQWMNGGFFVLNQEIFDYMHPGEDLACQPFQRLIARRKLACHNYRGFWGCMDTYKEKQALDDMFAKGNTPWELWNASKSSDPEDMAQDCGGADRRSCENDELPHNPNPTQPR
jgi:glucose-1-phosphate cytidylyltransferase